MKLLQRRRSALRENRLRQYWAPIAERLEDRLMLARIAWETGEGAATVDGAWLRCPRNAECIAQSASYSDGGNIPASAFISSAGLGALATASSFDFSRNSFSVRSSVTLSSSSDGIIEWRGQSGTADASGSYTFRIAPSFGDALGASLVVLVDITNVGHPDVSISGLTETSIEGEYLARVGDLFTISISTGVAVTTESGNDVESANVSLGLFQPNLEVTDVSFGQSGVDVTYESDVDLTEPVVLAVFWSDQGSYSSNSQVAAAAPPRFVTAQEGQDTVSIPAASLVPPPAWTQFLVAVIDHQNVVAEESEGDNDDYEFFTAALRPTGLNIISDPQSPSVGTPYTIALEVTNNSFVPLNYDLSIAETFEYPLEITGPQRGLGEFPGQTEIERNLTTVTIQPGEPHRLLMNSLTRRWDWIPQDNPLDSITGAISLLGFGSGLTEGSILAELERLKQTGRLLSVMPGIDSVRSILDDCGVSRELAGGIGYDAEAKLLHDHYSQFDGHLSDIVNVVVPSKKQGSLTAYCLASQTAGLSF